MSEKNILEDTIALLCVFFEKCKCASGRLSVKIYKRTFLYFHVFSMKSSSVLVCPSVKKIHKKTLLHYQVFHKRPLIFCLPSSHFKAPSNHIFYLPSNNSLKKSIYSLIKIKYKMINRHIN